MAAAAIPADAPGDRHAQPRNQVKGQGDHILRREDAPLDGPDSAVSASRGNDRPAEKWLSVGRSAIQTCGICGLARGLRWLAELVAAI
jgi:hypothetical protein